ncbi:MAG: molybdopterin-binding protein [Sporomusaceae bacterium]|nr:molybdopterin-binding protein [Sporomusaceae bacterium]
MKTIHVTEAIGSILGQDLTRVVPGQFKGVAFKKGHKIQPEDIPILLSMGKDHVYILELKAGDIHENDAAQKLFQLVAGLNIADESASEGKVTLRSTCKGLLKINVEKLQQINSLPGIAVSTLHTDTLVQENELVARTKIIPLAIPQTTLAAIQKICADGPIIQVMALPAKKVGLVITGNEVFYGRIPDKFEKVMKAKLASLGSQVVKTIFTPDNPAEISAAIETLAQTNDLVLVTGGMSVDPDDVTPLAIRQTGADVTVYGTPVSPGYMFLLARLKETPILGIPACGMYHKITILDVLLPRILLNETITAALIAAMGHGGLCLNCEICRYPHCNFCK